MELQNSKILKHWANDESGFMTGLLTVPRYFSKVQKGQFAQNLENGSDIYEHVQKVKILKHIKVLRIFRSSDQPIYLLSNFYKIFCITFCSHIPKWLKIHQLHITKLMRKVTPTMKKMKQYGHKR